jgi:hypothetical protein
VHKKICKGAGHHGSCLQSQLGRQRSGGSWFKPISTNKKLGVEHAPVTPAM